MNKPTVNLEPAGDHIGPLDEHGQEIWSAEEHAAVARLHADPEYWAGIIEAENDIRAGRVYTPEEVGRHMAELRRRFLEDRQR